jgi:hypothetical protein
MFRFSIACPECGKKLLKDESAIIINQITAYHPDCYRKNRETSFKGLEIMRNEWLNDAATRISSFTALETSDLIKDSKTFFDAWGKQLIVPELLTMIVSDAQRMGVIGLIHEYQLKRKLSLIYHSITGLATEYREGFGLINIEIKQREMFPTVEISGSKNDSLEKLRQEEKLALKSIIESIKSVNSQNRLILEELRHIAKELTKAENKELKKQIEHIQKDLRPIP